MKERFSFQPLTRRDLPLLLHWLETPHVKAWWDHDIAWTPVLTEEKYGSYCAGYKQVGDTKKPMQAFIVLYDGTPIGYIQCYNVDDYPREGGIDVSTLPQKCAAIDFYIGNPAYIGKGLGVQLLATFLEKHVWQNYESCFVDPDKGNSAAIKTYKRAGFVPCGETEQVLLMQVMKESEKRTIPIAELTFAEISGKEPLETMQAIKNLITYAMGNPEVSSVELLLQNYMARIDTRLLICCMRGSIVGIIGLSMPQGQAAVIKHIATAPSYRHQGIGRALIGEAIKRYSLRVLCAETDTDAVAFYRSCGFAISEIDTAYGRRFACTLDMQKIESEVV